MAAGYLVVGIPGFAVRTSPHRNATPEIYLHNTLLLGGHGQVSYGQPMHDHNVGYTWLPFEIVNPSNPQVDVKGVILYRALPLPNDPPGYILVHRRAQTAKWLWERQGAQAIAVALSIRCTVQLRPSPDVGGQGGTGDDRVESTYNQQLGMEYAHDPVTGEIYWVSPSTDWENGAEGPGYYRRSGNERRKLVPGRRD